MSNYRFREPVSGFTHLIGAILALLGTVWLAVLAWPEPSKLLVVVIFGFSFVIFYLASSALHLVDGSPATLNTLRRLDHAAIYFGIAGTYTPIIFHTLRGELRVMVMAGIWAMAIAGAISKIWFFWAGHRSTAGYVAMGWLGILFAPQAMQALATSALLLILGGGIVYTIGAVIYALEKPNFHVHFGHHEVWHLFVMTGSALHFAVVLLYVV